MIKKYLNDADVILIFVGAGMSADSGINTFVQATKEWKKEYSETMTRHAFETYPDKAWKYYDDTYEKFQQAVPHIGYLHLYNEIKDKSYFIVTSNIDLLFEKSNFDAQNIHHVHGKITDVQCRFPCSQEIYKYKKGIHACPKCGRSLRPNTFLFDDAIERRIIGDSSKNFLKWIEEIKGKNVVVLEIGIGAEGLHNHAVYYTKELNSMNHIIVNSEPSVFCLDNDLIVIKKEAKNMFNDL